MTQYNRKYDCIFINIPRTGSGSISEHIATGGHRPLSERRNIMAARGKLEEYEGAFKFAFVRNPYTRFISAWCHLGLHKEFDLNKFLSPDPIVLMTVKKIFNRPSGLNYLIEKRHNLFRPQHEFLDTGDDDIHVYKYEALPQNWGKVCKKLGISPAPKLSHKNQATCDVELTDESKEILYNYYKYDFEEYGYTK